VQKCLGQTHLLEPSRHTIFDLQDWIRNGHRNFLGGMDSCCELFGHGVFVGFASPFFGDFSLPK
jgi:hypothetical protein